MHAWNQSVFLCVRVHVRACVCTGLVRMYVCVYVCVQICRQICISEDPTNKYFGMQYGVEVRTFVVIQL